MSIIWIDDVRRKLEKEKGWEVLSHQHCIILAICIFDHVGIRFYHFQVTDVNLCLERLKIGIESKVTQVSFDSRTLWFYTVLSFTGDTGNKGVHILSSRSI